VPDPSLAIEVMLEREATPEEIAAVERVLIEAGIDGTVIAVFERQSVGLNPWVLWIVVPAATRFLSAFMAEAGEDAWRRLKSWVLKLYASRATSKAPKSAITLLDEATNEFVLLRDNLPDLAWQLLFTIDFRETDSGQLRWDFTTNAWRDPWQLTD
jgi:hypothetical protein